MDLELTAAPCIDAAQPAQAGFVPLLPRFQPPGSLACK
jgi:hypothetical protein